MAQIVDKNGNPLEREALKEPQTAQIAQLHQEFSTHPTRGLTPGRLAAIMEEAERGDLTAQADLFEDIEEKDGHVMAELGKRKRALLGLDWNINPPRNATAREEGVAALVEDIILDIPNFEDVLLDMADAIGYGYSNLEYDWIKNKYWQPTAINHRPPSWFKINQNNKNKLMLRDNSTEGAELWNAGWIQHIHKSKSGSIARAGLHRALVWPFLFKNYSVRDLAEFLEIYGLPVRLGQYPRGATDGEKNTLLRAVVNMGHAAAGIIPEGMLVEFKEAAKGGSDPYVAMIEWCERTQSKAILGGTLTSQADGASSTNALGNVHNEVRHDILVSDARQIASTLTRDLVAMLIKLNGWGADSLRCPSFDFDTMEAEDLALFADAIPKLVAVGVQVPHSYIVDKLKIPAPEDGEPVLGLPVIEPKKEEKKEDEQEGDDEQASAKACDCSLAVLKNHTPSDFPDQDALEKAMDALGDDLLQSQMEDILKPILNIAKTAPDQLLGQLAEKFPEMDDVALQEQLARLIFVAETWGRLNGLNNK